MMQRYSRLLSLTKWWRRFWKRLGNRRGAVRVAEFVFKSRLNYSDRAIKLMSHETREHFYRIDKNDLFNQLKSAPGEVYSEEHRKLVRKWRV
jgi:hypothetical protein